MTARWAYTEAGAKKLLAFREAHAGQRVRTVVGSFKAPLAVIAPHDLATYGTWKDG
jgi:hypothetical protein